MLILRDREGEETHPLTEALDRPVGGFAWNSMSDAIYASIDSDGNAPIIEIPIRITEDGARRHQPQVRCERS